MYENNMRQPAFDLARRKKASYGMKTSSGVWFEVSAGEGPKPTNEVLSFSCDASAVGGRC